LPTIQETAYPRLKSNVSVRDLAVIYTPNVDELSLAKQVTRGAVAQLGFLVLLKIFQCLGYFMPISQVPTAIIEHIAGVAQIQPAITELAGYVCLERASAIYKSYARHSISIAMIRMPAIF
jgi:hypothetical protein